MKHLRLIVYGSLAGLLIGGVAGALAIKPYKSSVVIRMVPSPVPERFAAALNLPVANSISGIMQVVLSHGNASSIINSYNLYPNERRKLPMEDVLELLRLGISITSPTPNTIEVSFTYPDRFVAQKVTTDVAARIMAEHVQTRVSAAMKTVMFMKDIVREAAADWEARLALARQGSRQGQSIERLKLDTDISRQRYESLSAKLVEAETAQTLERYALGNRLEVLDPASLPAESSDSILPGALAGLGIGGLLGWLASWMLSIRPRREPIPAV